MLLPPTPTKNVIEGLGTNCPNTPISARITLFLLDYNDVDKRRSNATGAESNLGKQTALNTN